MNNFKNQLALYFLRKVVPTVATLALLLTLFFRGRGGAGGNPAPPPPPRDRAAFQATNTGTARRAALSIPIESNGQPGLGRNAANVDRALARSLRQIEMERIFFDILIAIKEADMDFFALLQRFEPEAKNCDLATDNLTFSNIPPEEMTVAMSQFTDLLFEFEQALSNNQRQQIITQLNVNMTTQFNLNFNPNDAETLLREFLAWTLRQLGS